MFGIVWLYLQQAVGKRHDERAEAKSCKVNHGRESIWVLSISLLPLYDCTRPTWIACTAVPLRRRKGDRIAGNLKSYIFERKAITRDTFRNMEHGSLALLVLYGSQSEIVLMSIWADRSGQTYSNLYIVSAISKVIQEKIIWEN